MRPKHNPPRACETCGQEFVPHLSNARKGKGRYCSKTCGYQAARRPSVPEISADGLTARIPLRARDGSVRAYTIINAADVERMGQWAWTLDGQGYACRSVYTGGGRGDGRCVLYRLHRELLGLVRGDGLDVDHINRDTLDNRRSNLRVVPHTGRVNGQNRPSNRGSTSRYRGVYRWTDGRQWAAKIRVGGRNKHLGLFATEEEAAEAARAARLRLMPYAVD